MPACAPACHGAHDASAVLFGEMDIKDAGADLLETLSGEIPFAEISSKAEGALTDVIVAAGGCESKGEAKRKIKEGGVYLNGEKVADQGRTVSEADLLAGNYMQIRVGKKDFRLVKFVG